MARRIPEDGEGINRSERQVFDELCRQLPDVATVLPNLRFTDRDGDREADAVVVWPGVGVAVIEIKGAVVEYAGGDWHQHLQGETKRVNPVEQALKAKYAMRSYLRRSSRWRRNDPAMVHHVVLPHTDLADDFQTPQCPREAISGRADISELAERLRIHMRAASKHAPVDHDDASRLIEALAGPSTPQIDQVTATAVAVEEREDAVDALTRRQASVLDLLRDNRRVQVLGGAGTGKTWLAVEQARRLASDGARVALLCYSRGLAQWLQRRVAMLSEHERPSFVGTFHSLGHRWGAKVPVGAQQSFWDVDLPAQMVQLAHYLQDDERFDAVVVDEAQDFALNWWEPVYAALADAERGRVVVFADEGQLVFSRGALLDGAFARASLDENLRNSVPIAQAFEPLGRHPFTPAGPKGPRVEWVSCPADEAVEHADAEVERLLERENWSADHLMLLTTWGRHPEQVARTDHLGREGYWDTFWDDRDVFYGHVLGVKGLERPVVVLAVNGFREPERAREMRYVGMSRARDLLVVCGPRP
ncbi:NERD domain-containing protein [Actinomycetospora callitridis]|uniref:NERD domain-containing protein n=1 Tax=Actinomycetospora callitridis TaxID=913944 RepID=UPI002365E217|nr:NERD domain-containing protein [Actinomycetospora callitridis]MDD7920006.1 NERD domain-containing protein [Actinomycetospora callitridis]